MEHKLETRKKRRAGFNVNEWEEKAGMVMFTALPLVSLLMMSWPVLTLMPSIDVGEIGQESSQSKYLVGGWGFSVLLIIRNTYISFSPPLFR